MEWQARVIEVRRGRLLVQPMDRARSICLKVPGCDRTYIENEMLRLGDLPDATPGDTPVAVEVLGSGLDPAHIDGQPPRLESWGTEDAYGFAEYVPYDSLGTFDQGMEFLEAGRASAARRAFRQCIALHPLHIDSYHHLGNIAWDAGRLTLALKYYEMGCRIGRLTVPAGFAGRLPWSILENRPFLRALHGRALALMKLGRSIEAADGFAEILRFNPVDNQGVRYLLPSLLAGEGALDRAREVLDQGGGPDGTNLFTRCLIDIEEGRRRDALRWFCAAVSYNPHVPGVLLGEEARDADGPDFSDVIVMGGPSEAIDYARHDGALWWQGKGERFLRQVLRIPPIADRLARLLDLERSLKDLPPGEERSRLVDRRFALFGDGEIRAILSECEPYL